MTENDNNGEIGENTLDDNIENNDSTGEINNNENNNREIETRNRIHDRHLPTDENIRTVVERLRFLRNFLNIINSEDFHSLNSDSVSDLDDEFMHQQTVQSILNSLPSFKIDQKFLDAADKSENEKMPKKKCIICMENYKIDDNVETLPCFHFFHKDCIDQWFKGNKDSCPICKHDVTKD